MAKMIGKATSFGTSLYNDNLLDKITRFCLIGADKIDDEALDSLLAQDDLAYANLSDYNVYEEDVTTAFIDSENQAVFSCNVPYETDTNKYIYGIALINVDSEGTKEVVDWATITPFFQKSQVGGTFEYTSGGSGTAGDIIFRTGDFVTKAELENLDLATNDTVDTIANDVNTNKTNINNLSSTVSDNTNAINTNKTDISNLSSTVSDNTSAIDTNKTDINNLSSTVSDNTNAIDTNKNNITTVMDTANTNKTDISNLSNRVTDNESNISSLDATLYNTMKDVGTNKDNINKLSTDFYALQTGRKNLIINGGFQVWQRGTSFSNLSDYYADRFHCYETGTNTEYSIFRSQYSGTTGVLIDINEAGTDFSSTNVFLPVNTILERLCCNWIDGKTITISFRIYTNFGGILPIALYNSSFNKCIVKEITSSKNAWVTVYTTIDIPVGFISTVDEIGLTLRLFACNEEDYETSSPNTWLDEIKLTTTNSVNWAKTKDNYIRIHDLQMELGSRKTNFEHLPYGEVLQSCKRYYEVVKNVNPATAIQFTSNGDTRLHIPFTVEKRTNPSCTVSTDSWNVIFFGRDGQDINKDIYPKSVSESSVNGINVITFEESDDLKGAGDLVACGGHSTITITADAEF